MPKKTATTLNSSIENVKKLAAAAAAVEEGWERYDATGKPIAPRTEFLEAIREWFDAYSPLVWPLPRRQLAS